MGFFNKGKAGQADYLMRSEFNKVAQNISNDILRSVDGSNADEQRLIASAKQLADLANSNAMRQLTASCLLATCRQAIDALDFSTDAERTVYYEASDLLGSFEVARALCA